MILASSNRRKRILFAAAGILVIWTLIGSVIIPIKEASDDTDKRIRDAKSDLKKISEMADKYITMSASLPAALKVDTAGVPILSTGESIARRLGMEKNIERMFPSPDPKNKNGELLTVSITSIPYSRLIDFLQAVQESGTMVVVKQAKITTVFDNKNNVTAELIFMKAN